MMLDEKRALQASRCSNMKVPTLPELGVQKIWPVLRQIPGILEYLPDNWQEQQPPMARVDRKFLW